MDPILESFLTATEEKEALDHLDGILARVSSTIRSITARSLEFQEDDQQETLARLVKTLQACRKDPEHHNIDDFTRYSMVVASHICKERLRRDNPRRGSLRDSLRHLINDDMSGFAMWRTGSGELLCGFSEWDGDQTCSSENLNLLISRPNEMSGTILMDRSPQNIGNHDLLKAVFNWLGHPLRFNELIRIAFVIKGVEEVTLIGNYDDHQKRLPHETLQSSEDYPDEYAEWREFLTRVWAEFESLPPLQRIAYLLNFTAAGGEIDIFMKYGVASVRKIGKVLALTDDQYAMAWQELIPDATRRKRAESLSSNDEKFAQLWPYLPLTDLQIARILGTERQKIINLRKAAGDRLSRRIDTREK